MYVIRRYHIPRNILQHLFKLYNNSIVPRPGTHIFVWLNFGLSITHQRAVLGENNSVELWKVRPNIVYGSYTPSSNALLAMQVLHIIQSSLNGSCLTCFKRSV